MYADSTLIAHVLRRTNWSLLKSGSIWSLLGLRFITTGLVIQSGFCRSSWPRITGRRLIWLINGCLFLHHSFVLLWRLILWVPGRRVCPFRKLILPDGNTLILHWWLSTIFTVLLEFPTSMRIWNKIPDQNKKAQSCGIQNREPNSKNYNTRQSTHFHHHPCHQRTSKFTWK